MNYKGYMGHIIYDDELRCFTGEVINTRDVITFQGNTVNKLEQAFHDSIDDYLEFCAERNEKPDRPFSGKFSLRVSPELHRKAAIEAELSHKSLNAWLCETIANATSHRT